MFGQIYELELRLKIKLFIQIYFSLLHQFTWKINCSPLKYEVEALFLHKLVQMVPTANCESQKTYNLEDDLELLKKLQLKQVYDKMVSG